MPNLFKILKRAYFELIILYAYLFVFGGLKMKIIGGGKDGGIQSIVYFFLCGKKIE